jgi:hypothetical protein
LAYFSHTAHRRNNGNKNKKISHLRGNAKEIINFPTLKMKHIGIQKMYAMVHHKSGKYNKTFLDRQPQGN